MGLYRKLFTGKSEISFEDIQFDDAALEMFFESYFEPLCAYCKYRFNFDIDQAKETVHIAFIRLWENRNSVSPDLSLKAYMYKIVTNISLDLLRHEKVKEKHERSRRPNPSGCEPGLRRMHILLQGPDDQCAGLSKAAGHPLRLLHRREGLRDLRNTAIGVRRILLRLAADAVAG